MLQGRSERIAAGLAVALVLTNAAIAGLELVKPAPSLAVEIATLTAANAIGTIVRFLLLRMLLVHLRSDNTQTEALRTHAL